MKKMHHLSFLVAALCSSLVLAESKAPDLSTPKSAAIAFGTALLADDSAGLHATATGSESDFKTVGALGTMVSAMKKLSDTASEKFGKDNVITKGTKDMDIAAELEKAEVKVEGDTATIINKEKADDKNPLKLAKKDGKWMVDLGSLPKEGMDQMVKLAPAMAKAANEVATEIKGDKYKTAEDAQQAMGTKMVAAMMQAAPPSAPGAPPVPPAPEK
jgi:hypothetical protein